MSKLLCADIERIRKSKLFWAEVIFLIGAGLSLMILDYRATAQYGDSLSVTFAECLFQQSIFIGILSAMFGSLFTGTEYSDGTIRNKLVVGQPRANIYLSSFISCTLASIAQAVVSVAAVFAVGFLLMGKPEMEAVKFLQLSVALMLLCMAYAAIFNLATMLLGSKSYAVTVSLLLAFLLLIYASYLSSRLLEPEMIQDFIFSSNGVGTLGDEVPNPYYLSGVKREVYQFLFDFLPGGQTLQLCNPSFWEGLLKHPALIYFYSVALAFASNVVGIVLFRRKDIK